MTPPIEQTAVKDTPIDRDVEPALERPEPPELSAEDLTCIRLMLL